MQTESKEIMGRILDFIEGLNQEEAAFNELAIALFAYQFNYNLPYKKYCQKQRKTPLTVRDWKEIPSLPLQAFKELVLSCEPKEEAEAVFMTSGTTNKDKRGKNCHPALDIWDASMVTGFKQFVLPDEKQMTIYVLSPAENMNQHSSLSRYLTMAAKHFGSERSRFFFEEGGLDMEGLARALAESEKRQEPVLLMGASFAYVHFLDYCAEQDMHFQLSEGSRLFDTGGFKGKSREIKEEQFYKMLEDNFGIKQNHCINMYGMTELSSQMYDQSFVTKNRLNRKKAGPGWVKTLVVHPETLEPVKNGDIGVLVHYDLANWNSCLAVLTEDMGYQTDDGFVLLGRAKGSEARGCSVAVDELMEANRK